MSIKNVCKVVVENPDGDILLLRRSATDPRRPGDWDFPGGEVELTESHTEGGIRETKEEAGLIVENLKILYMATELHPDSGESVNRALCYARVGTEAVSSVLLSYEHDKALWVPKPKALELFPHPFYGRGLQYAMNNDLLTD